jgi:ABC-type transporter Mla MlaB component
MGRSKTTRARACAPSGAPAALALPADLGIEHAAALKALLLPVAAQAVTVRIDGAAVSRLHAAPLQLLAAFWRDRRDRGLATDWVQASTSLREAAATLGLAGLLNLPMEPR